MIGNGILAAAIIFVVVIFVYLSLRLQRQQDTDRHFNETYTINLTQGFVGDSLSIYINDSLLLKKRITEEPFMLTIKRFADLNTLLVVDNNTDKLFAFDLSDKGGKVLLKKDDEEIIELKTEN